MTLLIDDTFPREWEAKVLPHRPLILPPRHFVYPAQVEDVERGALEVLVTPTQPPNSPFLATCALGFAGPHVPTGLWTCPQPTSICIAAGGYVYVLDTREPTRWQQVDDRPVTQIRPAANHGLLIFAGFHTIQAWNREGKAWQTGRLSWDGIQLTGLQANTLAGLGWDMLSDRELEFEVNLATGEHKGGGYLR